MKALFEKKNAIAFAACLLIHPFFSEAQIKRSVSLTFRPGANFATEDLGDVKLKNGGGFEVTVSYRFMQHLSAYAGYGWNAFKEAESTNDSVLEFKESGYTFGLQFIHPLSSDSKLSYMIGAGGIYNHIETENKSGDEIDDTGHGLGWQAEAGIAIPVGHHNRWQLIPALRYHSLSREISSNEKKIDANLNYVSIGMGVSWMLWGY